MLRNDDIIRFPFPHPISIDDLSTPQAENFTQTPVEFETTAPPTPTPTNATLSNPPSPPPETTAAPVTDPDASESEGERTSAGGHRITINRIRSCRKQLIAGRGERTIRQYFHQAYGSVEQKLAGTFAKALVAKSDSTRGCRMPVVVDIGVNDGGDIHTWFKHFGRSNNSCTRYFLLEPQQSYSKSILNHIALYYYRNASSRSVLDATTVWKKPLSRRMTLLIGAAGATPEKHNTTAVMVAGGQGGMVILNSTDDVASKSATRQYNLPLLFQYFGVNRITFLKIDCEGADATIVVGLAPLLQERRIDFVVFEVNKLVHRYSVGYREAISLLKQSGYHVFLVALRHDPLKWVLYEIDENNASILSPKLETLVAVLDISLLNGLVSGSKRMTPEDGADFAGISGISPKCFPASYYVPLPPWRERSIRKQAGNT